MTFDGMMAVINVPHYVGSVLYSKPENWWLNNRYIFQYAKKSEPQNF